ncbi:MAG: N-acetylmuramoyl-L-alanine amidase [Clostridia bacterium]|nr:N-acetylmuramoyl-L-alanine amidase [Clostridia bacterium]
MKRPIFTLLALLPVLLTACGDPASVTPTVGGDAVTFADPSPAVTSAGTTVSGSTTTLPTPTTTVPVPPTPSVTEPPKTDVPATESPVTTDVPTTDAPITEPPVTNDVPTTDAPPVIEPPAKVEELPEMGDAPSVLEYSDRRVLYTVEETTLSTADGTVLIRLGAGHALIAVEETEEAVTILYRGWLCSLSADQLTEEAPSSALALQDALGGIYYPASTRLIAVDAGHQGKAMKEKEPLGPGSDDLKAMLSSGTAGVSTRIAERELNLRVSLLLRDELIARGYSVLMIRESHSVTISNAQRALMANAYGADAFVRIHANGSANSETRGAMTICQTKINPYNGQLYEESYALSLCMLEHYSAVTGIRLKKVWQTDTMTGINWATVPVTIVEMGYMSNAEEDELMATDAFRKSAAVGMADGLDAYFEWKSAN